MKIKQSKMAVQLCVEYAVAALIRYLAMTSDLAPMVSERVEISTPLNAWKRVTEAAYIHAEHHIDPYTTDSYHDTPLNLELYKLLIKHCARWLPIVFIVCDLYTATVLLMTARQYMRRYRQQEQLEKPAFAPDSHCLLLSDADYHAIPTYVFSCYLFNPYIVLNCVGMTTTTFTNLLMAVALYGIITKCRWVCCVALALATSQSLYPAVLVVPLALSVAQGAGTRRGRVASVATTGAMFAASVGGVLAASYYISGSWAFLHNTFGFILTVSDLRPNIGTTWYFFTEMFEHFRPLFLCALQINVSILYLVPLSLKFHTEPMLLSVAITALTTMFRTYPSIGDVGLYLSLLPMWKHLFPFMQQRFIVCCVFLMTSVIAPVFWHLWIYSGAANANFYFGVTLAFTVAQIFVLTDLLFAYIKRRYFLENGCLNDNENNKYKLIFW